MVAMNADNPPASSFAARVRSAVFWRWGGQVLAQLITWSATIIIVRLLNPHDYGLFAMTQAVLTALNFLNGYAFASSLIQSDEVTDRQIGQVFGMLLASNGMLAVIQFLSAPLVAGYYDQPAVADMLRVQALLFLATPFIALPTELMARVLDFRRQAVITLICVTLGAAASLFLAWNGYGVWALVWAPIIMFACRAVGLSLAWGKLIRPVFDFRGAGKMLGYGVTLTLCQLCWIIQSQADIVIAGRHFTAHELGIYSEALFLTLIFNGRFLPPLNEVAYPAYAELKNNGQPIGPAFLSTIRMILLTAAPFYIGLSLVAEPLVTLFFGPKWLEMIPIVAGLAAVMPLMSLQIACSPPTNALGRPRIYLFTAASGALIMPLCYLFGVAYGLQGLVTAWHLAAPLLLAVTLAATLPVIGVRLIDLVKTLLPVGAACLVMALVVRALQMTVLSDLALPVQLGASAAVGAATYVGTLRLIWPQVLTEVWLKLRQPKGGAAKTPPHEAETAFI
jgi:O-antigen/teichoic acid export membrane protein